jgi:hypothetical protein
MAVSRWPRRPGEDNNGGVFERPGLVRIVSSWFRGRRPTAEAPARDPSGLDPVDLADIDQRLAAVHRDAAHDRDLRLAVLLHRLVDKGVPLRVVEPVPSLRTARMRFADGTAVLVRGDVRGDVAVLAGWMRDGSIVPTACSTRGDGTHLVLRSRCHAHPVSVRVTGMDQPD